MIVNYHYDAWGRIISVTDSNGVEITDTEHIAYVNPFRYRSYYYDSETGYYYLNSRYYDPNWGRFLNADGILKHTSKDMISLNLYSYCSNNPINQFDESGYGWLKNLWNAAKKKVNKIAKAISKVVKTIKKSFVFEAGVGVGASVSSKIGPAKVHIGLYKDFGFAIKNEEIYDYSTTNVGLQLTATEKKQFGLNAEINHKKDNDFQKWRHDNPMVMPWEIRGCDNTSGGFLLGTIYKQIGSVETDDEEIFIGIELEAHLVLGGHIKIGFNIK